jgi:hypothetical protein
VSGDLVRSGQLDLDAGENEEPITALVRRLERAGLIDEVALHTEDLQDLSLDQADGLLRFFAGLHRGSAWWLGDLNAFAEARWNEEASQLADATSLNKDTIARYTTTAREFPPRERVAGLGISHHRLVTHLDAGVRRAWLERARAGDNAGEGPWTVDRLREELQLAGLKRDGRKHVQDSNPGSAEISRLEPLPEHAPQSIATLAAPVPKPAVIAAEIDCVRLLRIATVILRRYGGCPPLARDRKTVARLRAALGKRAE